MTDTFQLLYQLGYLCVIFLQPVNQLQFYIILVLSFSIIFTFSIIMYHNILCYNFTLSFALFILHSTILPNGDPKQLPCSPFSPCYFRYRATAPRSSKKLPGQNGELTWSPSDFRVTLLTTIPHWFSRT